MYHLTARGNERRAIYRDDHDRQRFVEKLRTLAEQHRVAVHAYVLMPNHYHLVVSTPRANLSAFMQQLNTSYTVYHNRRHRRCGHLFAGRFKARLVEGGTYLLALTRYVHLNPVKIRAARSLPVEERLSLLNAYGWSSYRSYAGLSESLAWVDHGPLKAFADVGEVEGAAVRQAYREYVEQQLVDDDTELLEALRLSSKAVGSVTFCQAAEQRQREIRDAAPGKQRWLDISRRRVEVGATEQAVTAAVVQVYSVQAGSLRGRGNCEARDVWMRLLREECGLTDRAIGRLLGHADGSTVGARLRAVERRFLEDAELRRRYAQSVQAERLIHIPKA
jgi:REP element-mobilizing transposase RayT